MGTMVRDKLNLNIGYGKSIIVSIKYRV